MAAVVFILCAITSAICLALLVRTWRQTGGRLVMWTAICFAGLALNNLLLAIDQVALKHTTLGWRAVPAAVGLCALLYGLLVEERAR
jgi:hypothetical protein